MAMIVVAIVLSLLTVVAVRILRQQPPPPIKSSFKCQSTGIGDCVSTPILTCPIRLCTIESQSPTDTIARVVYYESGGEVIISRQNSSDLSMQLIVYNVDYDRWIDSIRLQRNTFGLCKDQRQICTVIKCDTDDCGTDLYRTAHCCVCANETSIGMQCGNGGTMALQVEMPVKLVLFSWMEYVGDDVLYVFQHNATTPATIDQLTYNYVSDNQNRPLSLLIPTPICDDSRCRLLAMYSTKGRHCADTHLCRNGLYGMVLRESANESAWFYHISEQENATNFGVEYRHPLDSLSDDVTLVLIDYGSATWAILDGNSAEAILRVLMVTPDDVIVLSVIDYQQHLKDDAGGRECRKLVGGQTIDFKRSIYVLMLNCVRNVTLSIYFEEEQRIVFYNFTLDSK